MAIFHPKFRYKDKTNNDYGLIAAVFDSDDGEAESFLSMEPVFTESADGTHRFDYGAKYDSVVTIQISLIKADYTDLTVLNVRSVLKWLTGSKINHWLDFYNQEEEIIYSFLGRFTNVRLRKIDGRVIGVVAEFTSVSPWAYSDIKTKQANISGSVLVVINNQSDDLETKVYPNIVFRNGTTKGNLSIRNNNTSEEFTLNNIVANEVVTIDSNQMIYSDNITRVFGNDCNYKFISLIPDINQLVVTGRGSITFTYRSVFKVADALLDIESSYNDTSVTYFDDSVTSNTVVNGDRLTITLTQNQVV